MCFRLFEWHIDDSNRISLMAWLIYHQSHVTIDFNCIRFTSTVNINIKLNNNNKTTKNSCLFIISIIIIGLYMCMCILVLHISIDFPIFVYQSVIIWLLLFCTFSTRYLSAIIRFLRQIFEKFIDCYCDCFDSIFKLFQMQCFFSQTIQLFSISIRSIRIEIIQIDGFLFQKKFD